MAASQSAPFHTAKPSQSTNQPCGGTAHDSSIAPSAQVTILGRTRPLASTALRTAASSSSRWSVPTAARALRSKRSRLMGRSAGMGLVDSRRAFEQGHDALRAVAARSLGREADGKAVALRNPAAAAQRFQREARAQRIAAMAVDGDGLDAARAVDLKSGRGPRRRRRWRGWRWRAAPPVAPSHRGIGRARQDAAPRVRAPPAATAPIARPARTARMPCWKSWPRAQARRR
ncbi:hypothetical protein Ddc_23781 [Ditylenchus destructor]|nr:hypothetical protein Ddc_23781 [Ditylenchus destructor]